jgi:hypothetical protein
MVVRGVVFPRKGEHGTAYLDQLVFQGGEDKVVQVAIHVDQEQAILLGRMLGQRVDVFVRLAPPPDAAKPEGG